MNLPVFSFLSATSTRPGMAVRLPQLVTATTGCALTFSPIQVVELPTAAAPSAAPRRPGRDVHQGSYYAQCRVAMGY